MPYFEQRVTILLLQYKIPYKVPVIVGEEMLAIAAMRRRGDVRDRRGDIDKASNL